MNTLAFKVGYCILGALMVVLQSAAVRAIEGGAKASPSAATTTVAQERMAEVKGGDYASYTSAVQAARFAAEAQAFAEEANKRGEELKKLTSSRPAAPAAKASGGAPPFTWAYWLTLLLGLVVAGVAVRHGFRHATAAHLNTGWMVAVGLMLALAASWGNDIFRAFGLEMADKSYTLLSVMIGMLWLTATISLIATGGGQPPQASKK